MCQHYHLIITSTLGCWSHKLTKLQISSIETVLAVSLTQFFSYFINCVQILLFTFVPGIRKKFVNFKMSQLVAICLFLTLAVGAMAQFGGGGGHHGPHGHGHHHHHQPHHQHGSHYGSQYGADHKNGYGANYGNYGQYYRNRGSSYGSYGNEYDKYGGSYGNHDNKYGHNSGSGYGNKYGNHYGSY